MFTFIEVRAMPITRIFRVRINAELRQEFEKKFTTVSVNAVQDAPGIISSVILRPTI